MKMPLSLNVVNLTNFTLNESHISLLKRGLTLSPSTGVNEFEIFKDLTLYLRKVLLKLQYGMGRPEDMPPL